MKNLKLLPSLIFMVAFLGINDVDAQRNSNIGHYSIETECLGVEMDGSVTLRAWGTGRKMLFAMCCSNPAERVALIAIRIRWFPR
ncbi:MAG: hypothetical protein H6Q19_1598 [Bacteroidetes bacterium]|nr:hypothetical protein [Bacteroidota bacterium]